MKTLSCVLSIIFLAACAHQPAPEPTPASVTASREPAASADIYVPFTQAVNEGKEDKIQKEAKAILETHPDDTYVLNGLSHFYRKSKRLKMSETLTKRVLSKHPKDLRAKRNLAYIHLDRQEDTRALQVFLEIFNSDKVFPDVPESIAKLYLKYDREPAAVGILSESLDAADFTADRGRELSRTYLAIIENNPGLVSSQESMLQKLAGQKADQGLADRARTLLSRGKG